MTATQQTIHRLIERELADRGTFEKQYQFVRLLTLLSLHTVLHSSAITNWSFENATRIERHPVSHGVTP